MASPPSHYNSADHFRGSKKDKNEEKIVMFLEGFEKFQKISKNLKKKIENLVKINGNEREIRPESRVEAHKPLGKLYHPRPSHPLPHLPPCTLPPSREVLVEWTEEPPASATGGAEEDERILERMMGDRQLRQTRMRLVSQIEEFVRKR